MAFFVFFCVDGATEGAGLLLDITAGDNHKARAGRFIEGVPLFVNIHMLRVQTAPRGDIFIREAKIDGATDEVARDTAFAVGIGVGEQGTTACAFEKPLRYTLDVFVLFDIHALDFLRKEDGGVLLHPGKTHIKKRCENDSPCDKGCRFIEVVDDDTQGEDDEGKDGVEACEERLFSFFNTEREHLKIVCHKIPLSLWICYHIKYSISREICKGFLIKNNL